MPPKSENLARADGGLKPPKSPNNTSQALTGRRSSHGQGQVRKPGVEWNDADEIDDGRDEALDGSEYDTLNERQGQPTEKKSPSGGQIIDLLDIARPAKPKGIAKEFEVVQGSPRIIALPDEPNGPAAKEEDWENIDSEETDPRKSYSAALRDKEQ